MSKKLQKRDEVKEEYTWDLTAIYETEGTYEKEVTELQAYVSEFIEKYEGHLDDSEMIVSALEGMETIITKMARTSQYANLPTTVDVTDNEAKQVARKNNQALAELSSKLSFFSVELTVVSDDVLEQVARLEPRLEAAVRQIKNNKKVSLSKEAEEVVSLLSPTLNASVDTYETMKLADMDFPSFEVNGQTYPLSYQLYEDHYAFHPDTEVRRRAFDEFSKVLEEYQHSNASLYYTEVQKDKTIANLRGFDSVFDHLLYSQEVERELYDRQIDMIMADMAPVMQKYITHIREEQGLDKMTYADLKIELDPEYSVEVSIEKSKDYIEEATEILGKDYQEMVLRAYPERWIDFVRNQGKQTGGFCSTAYDVHPYILMTWNNQLSDVYTLIHELGHAGQGILSSAKQSPLSADPSMYVIEAPSTFNELLLTDYLQRESQNSRAERYAWSSMIANTYFHNFITHLHEAAYQREVYRLIDAGKSFGADELSAIKRGVLEEFWGDAVEINPGAELTWMRQPHYYMGLYSYTYSAGLTIATQAFLNIKSGGESAVEKWLEFLTLGDSLPPVESAAVAGVDITTEKALRDTIEFLDQTVDRIIELSSKTPSSL